MNADIQNALTAWEAAEAARLAAVEAELHARAVLMNYAFPTPTFGTNTAEVGDGRQLKGTFGQRYSVDKDKLEAGLRALPRAVRDVLVKYDPKLSVTAYKALEPAHKLIANEFVTITNDRPSLKIVVPKVS